MKNAREFLEALYRSRTDRVPFLRYFQESKVLRKFLFEQYLKTKPKPDLQLYYKDYYSEKQWAEGLAADGRNFPVKTDRTDKNVTHKFLLISDFDRRTREIKRKFQELILKNKLPAKYYSHSIENTKLYEKLDLVFTRIGDFKKQAFEQDDYDRIEVESFCKSIIRNLEETQIPELLEIVLEDFVQEQENEFIETELFLVEGNEYQQAAKGNYRKLKGYVDNHITEYLRNSSAFLNESQLNPCETLSELITHEKSSQIVEKIKIQYKNIRGKRLKLLLTAFQDLRLLPKERIGKKFYDCCKNEFPWEIASYNAMNGYNYNPITDMAELDQMKVYIKTLIKTE